MFSVVIGFSTWSVIMKSSSQIWQQVWRIDSRVRMKTIKLQLLKVAKSCTHSDNFVLPKILPKAHHSDDQIYWVYDVRRVPKIQKARGRWPNRQRNFVPKNASFGGKKTMRTRIKYSSTDIGRKTRKWRTFGWGKNLVFMQHFNNHVNDVNKYCREDWKWC